MKLFPQRLWMPIIAMLGLLCGCKEEIDEELLYVEDANYLEWVGKNVDEADFKFTSLTGQHIDLAKYRGRVVLLDFWATWGPPCIEAIPEKLSVHQKYQHMGFEIIGVSADFDRDDLGKVIDREKITWPQYFNPQGKDNAAVKKFGITHFPSMWLVDRKGTVRFISAGKNLSAKIEVLLREGGAPAVAPGKTPSWKERIMSSFGSETKEDPIAARDELMNEPEQYLDVKNIMITSSRRIATLKTPNTTHQLVIGKQIDVQTESGKVLLTCKEINRDGLVMMVPGNDTPIRVAF